MAFAPRLPENAPFTAAQRAWLDGYIAGWFGFYAPKGTPAEIVARLNAAMVQALADAQVKARFAQLGLDVAAREQQTPEGLATFQNAEMDKWWPIIKAAGIRGE